MLKSFNIMLPPTADESIAKIEAALNRGDLSAASIAIDRYAHNYPEAPNLGYLRASLSRDRGDFAQALLEIDVCIARYAQTQLLSPHYLQAACLRAQILADSGEKAIAKQALEQLLPLNCPLAYKLLALFALDEADYAEIARVCAAGIAVFPYDASLWLAQAQNQAINQEYAAASISLSTLLAIEPQNTSGLTLSTQVELQLENFPRVVDSADRLLEIEPDNVQALAHKFFACLALNRWDDADCLFPKLVKLDPDSAQLYASAWSEVERARSNTAFNHDTLFDSGLALYRQGEVDKAAVMFNNARQLNPGDRQTLIWLATCYNLLERCHEAIGIYKSLDLNEASAEELHSIRAGWGSALLKLGCFSLAIEQLEIADRICPDMPSTLTNLAICYGNVDRVEAAIDFSGKALAIEPSNVDTALVHASFLVLGSRRQEALFVAIQALKRVPLSPKCHYLMAHCLAALSRNLEALPYVYQYLKREPADQLGVSTYLNIIKAIDMELGVDRGRQN